MNKYISRDRGREGVHLKDLLNGMGWSRGVVQSQRKSKCISERGKEGWGGREWHKLEERGRERVAQTQREREGERES